MLLKDKVVIVTGAGQGIGRAIAIKAAEEGAKVCVAELNIETAEKVVGEIKGAGGEAAPFQVDVSDFAKVDGTIKEVIRLFGRVDVLVNNAGWDKIEPFLKSEESTWNKVININFKGPIHCFKAVLPYMVECKYGKIVSVASDAGRVGSTGEAVYSGAKGGIIAFSKTIAREVAQYGINVNCVSPGPTETPLLQEVAAGNPKLMDSLKRVIPLGKLGRPEDIANAVAFLVSDGASHITGQVLSVSGGLTMA